MQRTALRLSTVAALLNGGSLPYPTVAGEHVFDSRQDLLDENLPLGRHASIVVRTDDDRITAQNANGMSGVKKRSIDLRLELSIVTSFMVENEAGEEEQALGWPETEPSLEAFLDLMEYQVGAALFGSGPWAVWWQKLNGVANYVSVPMWTNPSEGRVRLAMREIALSLPNVGGECFPRALHIDDTEKDSANQPILLMRLPSHLLNVLNKIIADGAGDIQTAAAQIKSDLELQRLPVSSVHPALAGVRMKMMNPSIPPTGEQPAVAVEAELFSPIP